DISNLEMDIFHLGQRERYWPGQSEAPRDFLPGGVIEATYTSATYDAPNLEHGYQSIELLPLTALERAEQTDFSGDWAMTFEMNDPTAGKIASAGVYDVSDQWFEIGVGNNGNWISGELKFGSFYTNFSAAADLIDGQVNTLTLKHDSEADTFTFWLDGQIIGETAYDGDLSDLDFEALHIGKRARWWAGESDGTRDELNSGGIEAASFTDLDGFDFIL
ncbi:MAG: hypothetical protein AAGA71_21175, partial [Pseudomonadota bacterium]